MVQRDFGYRDVPQDFTGLVFYTNLGGEFVNGYYYYYYVRGKISKMARKGSAGSVSPSQARSSCFSVPLEQHSGWVCVGDNCSYKYTNTTYVNLCDYTEETEPDTDDGGGYGGETTDGGGGDGDSEPPSNDELENAIYEKPFALLPDVPCAIVQQWVALAKFTVGLAQQQKVGGIVTQNSYPSFSIDIPASTAYLSKVLDIDNAYSSVVNMDYFGVRVNTLPMINGQRATAEQFLNLIRININNFVDTENSEFTPYNHYNVDDRALWSSNNPLGAIVSIDIWGPRNGSVIVSNYNSNSWTFSTLKDPFNGVHPVSGNREFGFTTNTDGSYTFYTRGVDRLSDAIITGSQIVGGIPFNQADELWTSFQNRIKLYVNNHSGNASNSITETYRPDWSALKDVVDGKKPLSTLSTDCK
ncbi:hypothetical protein [Rufibacter sp. XAAS-G3-1]|uniref:hypothetical protein n=1 Tax=Rufibacter sp. XAAS-G3-1 TaxID=2729134 RepID=UPI0015E6F5A0|nr:hypothetical protein [Rufibacter sp. XAAS-G3-1]